jgi:hypothetical protein
VRSSVRDGHFDSQMKEVVDSAIAQSLTMTDDNFFSHKDIVKKLLKNVAAMMDNEQFDTVTRQNEMFSLLTLLVEYSNNSTQRLTVFDVVQHAKKLRKHISQKLSDNRRRNKKDSNICDNSKKKKKAKNSGTAPAPLAHIREQFEALKEKMNHQTSAEVRELASRVRDIQDQLDELEEDCWCTRSKPLCIEGAGVYC